MLPVLFHRSSVTDFPRCLGALVWCKLTLSFPSAHTQLGTSQCLQKSLFPTMMMSVVLMILDYSPWHNVQDTLDNVPTSHAFGNTGRNVFLGATEC